MRTECVTAVTDAIGRRLTKVELEALEDRVRGAFPRARRELMKAGTALTPATMTAAAGKIAAEGIVKAAQRAKRNAALTVAATARIDAAVRAHPGGMMKGLMSVLVRDTGDRGTTLSVEARQKAIANLALSELVESLDAVAPRFFGLLDNGTGEADVVRELFGERTGNADAKAAAEAWTKMADGMRQRFNDAGGDVGSLRNWRMPQSHSQRLIAEAGPATWVQTVLPLIDREQYVNPDGSLFSHQQMEAFLLAAYDTLSTGGLNGIRPEMGFKPAGRAVANRHAEHRELHFRNAEAFLQYQASYSERGLWDAWLGHVHKMARDTGLVEALGPNPGYMVGYWVDVATKAGEKQSAGLGIQAVYDELSGATAQAENETFARFMRGARNLQVASKLGGAVLSSVVDEATLAITARLNGLPEVQLLRNELAALNPLNQTERDLARRAGLSLDTLLHEMHRFGDDRLGAGWTDKLANATMRASGLNALTEARKRAFGVTMMSAVGKLSRQEWASIDPSDLRILESKGITSADWKVWQLARLEDWGGGNDTMLTPQAVMQVPDASIEAAGLTIVDAQRVRQEAATKLLGAILEETDIAVVTPGARERAILNQGTKTGTVQGELLRSLLMFKSFPVALIARHWMRGASLPTGSSRAAYLASLAVGTTVLGGLAMTAKDIAKGRDPKDFTQPETWVAAMLQGGGFGIFGDFLLADQTRYGHSFAETLAGPMVGTVSDLYGLSVGNVHQAAAGEETHAGAEAVRFAQSNAPLINLWYTRAALNHLFFHQVQEYLSPGYLVRMKQRAERDSGQRFWWAPGDVLPERGPDFAAAVGG